MDVLSDVMTVLRTGSPFVARFARNVPWSNQHADHPDGFGVQIMVRGSAILTTPAGETLTLGEGDALLLPRGSAHTIADSPDTPPGPLCSAGDVRAGAVIRSATSEETTHAALCMAYELAPGRTHPMIASMPDFVHLPSDPAARPELAGAIAMLDKELQTEISGSDTLVPALLDAILMYLLRALLLPQTRECGVDRWAAALADPPTAAALQAIHAAPERQWTVASLGEVAGLSRSAFSRRFTDLVGQPPLAYLTSWRLTLAARLLSESDSPLSTVARKVGYASEFAFATAFKRAFSTPPGRFRKETAACYATEALLRAA